MSTTVILWKSHTKRRFSGKSTCHKPDACIPCKLNHLWFQCRLSGGWDIETEPPEAGSQLAFPQQCTARETCLDSRGKARTDSTFPNLGRLAPILGTYIIHMHMCTHVCTHTCTIHTHNRVNSFTVFENNHFQQTICAIHRSIKISIDAFVISFLCSLY